MKLLTWNCQGAFRKKAAAIARAAPDLAVIAECECPAKLCFVPGAPPPSDFLWHGDQLHKGVGVFAYHGVTLQLDPSHDPSIKHCLPIRVAGLASPPLLSDAVSGQERGQGGEAHLLAIWAMGHKQKALSYVGQVYRAIHHYRDFIAAAPTIIAGDWNSNAIWDRERAVNNHSNVIKLLAAMGIVSLYHEHWGEAHGRETIPTYWHYRDRSRGYHLDYCCTPQTWLPQLRSLTVGDYEAWGALSDHAPIFAEFG